MNFNFLSFPAHKNFEYLLEQHKEELVFIQKIITEHSDSNKYNLTDLSYIHAFFTFISIVSSFVKNISIYFHCNSDDILIARDLADYIRSHISMNIIAVE
jgi:hypothetical protein